MARKLKRSGVAGRKSGTGRRRSEGVSLDAFATETLRLFVRAMVRGGYSGAELVSAIKAEVDANPPSVRPAGRGGRPDSDDAAHILTLWSRDPDYLTPNGSLRPIPALGPPPSIEALLARVSPRLTFDEVWTQLNRTSTLQQIGDLYVPSREAVIYLADPRQLSSHNLRVLNAALHTLEHNFTNGLSEPWYERSAQQAAFPVDAVTGYLEGSIGRAMEFLKAEDSIAERIAARAPSPQPRCRLSINLFYTVLDEEEGDAEREERS
jgi:hypothetical protein